jgi:hypothetical protein
MNGRLMTEAATEKKVKQKLPPEDWGKVELDVLTHELAIDIGEKSHGLDEQEVCDFWGLSYEELEGNDKWFFDFHYKKGRSEAKADAVKSLFRQMKGRNGKDASLAYLLRFNDDWDKDVEDKTQGRRYVLSIE